MRFPERFLITDIVGEYVKSSTDLDQLATALSQAQLKIPKVPKSGWNPHFKSHYAKLDDMLEAIRRPLAENGLSLLQAASFDQGRIVLTTRLLHKSGQWLESELAIKPAADTAQAIGSAISYAKRYQCGAMLAISESEDDDGESASLHPVGHEHKYKEKQDVKKTEGYQNPFQR